MRNRLNEEITEETILLKGDDGKLSEVSVTEALSLARARGMDLAEVWATPHPAPKATVVCKLLRIRRPLVWEQLPTDEHSVARELDESLWLRTNHCDGDHFLLGNPHTFPGRLSAWCPSKKQSFCISKSEIAQCSKETSYYLKGFLSGQEPEAPVDDEGDLLSMEAWYAATELFQQTGSWNARFRVCSECGARLLPSNPQKTCRVRHQG
jgi:hypothetical protein